MILLAYGRSYSEVILNLFWLLDNNTRYQVDSSSSIIWLWNLSLDDISTTVIMEHSRIQDCLSYNISSHRSSSVRVYPGQFILHLALDMALCPWSVVPPLYIICYCPTPFVSNFCC